MNHLSPDDQVDALGRDPAPRVAAHLAACDRCRREVEDLEATIAAAKDVDVPEPSPSFWRGFAARVTAATGSMAAPRRAWWRGGVVRSRWALPLAAAAVIAIAVAASVVSRYVPQGEPAAFRAVGQPPIGWVPAVSEPATIEDESPWALVADANDGMEWDVVSAVGLDPEPGSADRAVMQLSDGERLELVRLLKAELAGSAL